MKQLMPDALLVDDSGSIIIFNVPFEKVKQMGPVFKLIESKDNKGSVSLEGPHKELLQQLVSKVNDIGVSQCTIEEVFIKATKGQKHKE